MKCTFIIKLSLPGDQIHGYVDISDGETENGVATRALVFMVVAINESWKIPIAYFLINSMTGTERASIIRKSLVRLHAIGVKVVFLTCDGPSQNLAMIRELGANLGIMDMRPFLILRITHKHPCVLALLLNVWQLYNKIKHLVPL